MQAWAAPVIKLVYETLMLIEKINRLKYLTITQQQQQQQPFNGRLSGTTRVGWYQKKHSPAHTRPLSPFSICNGPWHPLYSAYVLDSPLEQPLSRSSLVFPLVLNPQLHA